MLKDWSYRNDLGNFVYTRNGVITKSVPYYYIDDLLRGRLYSSLEDFNVEDAYKKYTTPFNINYNTAHAIATGQTAMSGVSGQTGQTGTTAQLTYTTLRGGMYNMTTLEPDGALLSRAGYQAPETLKTCTHTFKLYEGIMNRYNYCVHCDIKQDVQS